MNANANMPATQTHTANCSCVITFDKGLKSKKFAFVIT